MSPFVPAIDALPDKDFADYFLVKKPIAIPAPPIASADDIRRARAIVAGDFTYTGETHRLSQVDPWFDNPSPDKEWQIALHKHYFAVDLIQALIATEDPIFLDTWIALTEWWLKDTRPGQLATSDAHVDAKRIESWVTALMLLPGSPLKDRVDGAFLRRVLTRLAADARYVSENLRPSRNHRTFQLYALVLVGVAFPELSKAGELLLLGHEKLIENLIHDFGSDGVHIEGSTHYHNITLETALAFVKLSRMNGLAIPMALEMKLVRALEFAAHVQFPDGEIPLLNDSDNGDHSAMLRDGAELFGRDDFLWAATRGANGLPPSKVSKAFGGYVVLSDGWGRDADSFARRQHVVMDCAPLGEGSHSHYDLMSLTWFAAGRQIVVDPGRFTYNAEPGEGGLDWRHEFKSTRYHNTVEIDGLNQTRYLSKARIVAHGLEALDRKRHKAKHGPEIERLGFASHFGVTSDWAMTAGASQEYRPIHTRAVVFMARRYLAIIDHVDMVDDEVHRAALRFHLAASERGRVTLSERAGAHTLRGEGYRMHVFAPNGATSTLTGSWVSKLYGVKSHAPCFELTSHGRGSLAFLSVLVPDDVMDIETAELGAASGGLVSARITSLAPGQRFEDRLEVRPNGLGMRIERRAGGGRTLYETGNMSASGEMVPVYEIEVEAST